MSSSILCMDLQEGADGRHCCLFCEITKENMKIKPSEKGRCKLRTLASLQEDYNKFVQSGYNIKNAQCHNNVSEEAMLDIPIDQVALPGRLHISLGVFHKFFKILEDECSVLNIKIAEKLAEKEEGAGNENFQSFIESVEKMSRVETSIAKLSDEIQFLNDAIRVQISNNLENEMLLRNLYTKSLEELHKELRD